MTRFQRLCFQTVLLALITDSHSAAISFHRQSVNASALGLAVSADLQGQSGAFPAAPASPTSPKGSPQSLYGLINNTNTTLLPVPARHTSHGLSLAQVVGVGAGVAAVFIAPSIYLACRACYRRQEARRVAARPPPPPAFPAMGFPTHGPHGGGASQLAAAGLPMSVIFRPRTPLDLAAEALEMTPLPQVLGSALPQPATAVMPLNFAPLPMVQPAAIRRVILPRFLWAIYHRQQLVLPHEIPEPLTPVDLEDAEPISDDEDEDEPVHPDAEAGELDEVDFKVWSMREHKDEKNRNGQRF